MSKDIPTTLHEALEEQERAFSSYTQRIDDRLGKLEARFETGEYLADRRSDPGERFKLSSKAAADLSQQLRDLAKGEIKAINISRPQAAIDTSSTSTGGSASAEFLDGIEQIARRASPVMGLCRNVSWTGNASMVVADNDSATTWVGEASTRNLTQTSSFHKRTPSVGTIYAYPAVTEESLDDIGFDIANFVLEDAGAAIGVGIGTAILTGDGSDKPLGLLSSTEVTTGDEASPARTYGVVQYFPSGKADGLQLDRLGSPPGDPAGVLYDTLVGLHSRYRQNAVWLMNSTTLATVRKLRDGDGNALFVPLSSGMDGVLIGRPIIVCEQMPDIATNAIPIACADMNQAYLLNTIRSMSITVDDNISAPGYVRYYIRTRVGGTILKDDAAKVVKCASS